MGAPVVPDTASNCILTGSNNSKESLPPATRTFPPFRRTIECGCLKLGRNNGMKWRVAFESSLGFRNEETCLHHRADERGAGLCAAAIRTGHDGAADQAVTAPRLVASQYSAVELGGGFQIAHQNSCVHHSV